ncbi:MAG: hypothetical protein AB2A00_10040 [Myxococcota bacterium]
MAFIKAVLIVALLGGLGVLIMDRDEIFLLQHYEGRVVHAYQDTAGFTDGRQDQRYMVQVETPDGTRTFEVPMRYFRELQPGASVKKSFLSTKLVISR